MRLRLVNWDRPPENEWLAVNQFTIKGDLDSCIPDLVGFVNGLPLLVIQFKKPGVSARVAFDDNLSHHKTVIPQLFWSHAFLIASKGTASRIGSLSADWGRFFEWKRIESRGEPRRVSLEVLLRGTCQPQYLQRKGPGDWTLVIVTDRTDLDEQIAGTFKDVGVVSAAEGDQCHAGSGAQLAEPLRWTAHAGCHHGAERHPVCPEPVSG